MCWCADAVHWLNLKFHGVGQVLDLLPRRSNSCGVAQLWGMESIINNTGHHWSPNTKLYLRKSEATQWFPDKSVFTGLWLQIKIFFFITVRWSRSLTGQRYPASRPYATFRFEFFGRWKIFELVQYILLNPIFPLPFNFSLFNCSLIHYPGIIES